MNNQHTNTRTWALIRLTFCDFYSKNSPLHFILNDGLLLLSHSKGIWLLITVNLFDKRFKPTFYLLCFTQLKSSQHSLIVLLKFTSIQLPQGVWQLKMLYSIRACLYFIKLDGVALLHTLWISTLDMIAENEVGFVLMKVFLRA